eukprot:gene10121-10188_t
MSERELMNGNDAIKSGADVLDYKSSSTSFAQQNNVPAQITFERSELNAILALYGRNVAAGEWRDYAIDFTKDRAVFSVFRRSTEVPLYRIEKDPKLVKKQGAFCVTNAAGLILKRGHELHRVLQILEPKPKLNVV